MLCVPLVDPHLISDAKVTVAINCKCSYAFNRHLLTVNIFRVHLIHNMNTEE